MSVNSTSNFLPKNTCNTVSVYIHSAFNVVKVLLLLPLSAFILYLGHQRWRQQRSFKAASHSDVVTYNMAAMELMWVLGCCCSYGGTYSTHSVIERVGSVSIYTGYYGEMCFHVLTCVERYLAVVHPIIYLALRTARGIGIRNISIGCAWLLSFGLGALHQSNPRKIILICFVLLSVLIISFCSLSVLCVLIRPGPGKGGGQKERVDQLKLRAFHTITAISSTVWVWFVGLLLSQVVDLQSLLSDSIKCMVKMCVVWSNLPSCLVLPLLYLHRAGKLFCCCYDNK